MERQQENCCLNGVWSHWQSPKCNALDPHLITSQKGKGGKGLGSQDTVFASLSLLCSLPFPICLQSLMEKPTAPELILSHIALILIDLDISSPSYYLQHGIIICPLGTHSLLCLLALAGSFCTGESILLVTCIGWSWKNVGIDLVRELRTKAMRSCCIRGCASSVPRRDVGLGQHPLSSRSGWCSQGTIESFVGMGVTQGLKGSDNMQCRN